MPGRAAGLALGHEALAMGRGTELWEAEIQAAARDLPGGGRRPGG